MKVIQMAEISYIGLFLMIFIVIVVGVSLVQPVAQQVGTATADGNLSINSGGASKTILGMSTLMFIVMFVAIAAGLVIISMRLIGLD